MERGFKTKMYLRAFFTQIVSELKEVNVELSELVRTKGVIAGGAVRTIYMTGDYRNINDIDIYFVDKESATKAKGLANQTSNRMNPFTKKKGMITDNAWSSYSPNLDLKFQIIYKFANEPNQLINNFDFTNSMAVYVPQKDEIVEHPEFKRSLATKELKFNEDCFSPMFSINRMLKFMKQGYTIEGDEVVKLVKAAANDTQNHAGFTLTGSGYK